MFFSYSRFSQDGEALSALHEAIQMAQEAGDAICLQYALGWLHLITEQVDGEGWSRMFGMFVRISVPDALFYH